MLAVLFSIGDSAFITHNKTFNLPMLLLTAFLLLSLACLLLSPSMKKGGRKITPNIVLITAHWAFGNDFSNCTFQPK